VLREAAAETRSQQQDDSALPQQPHHDAPVPAVPPHLLDTQESVALPTLRTLAIPTRQTPISGGTATPQPWQQPSSLTHPHQTEDEVSSGIGGGGGNLGVQGRSPLAPIAVTEVNWPPHCSGADLLLPSEGTDPATIAEVREERCLHADPCSGRRMAWQVVPARMHPTSLIKPGDT
jgi:hypothetical protein